MAAQGSRTLKLSILADVDELKKSLNVGAKDVDGFADLNRPIEVDMKDASIGVQPLIAKAYNYEVPDLGIVKDKFMPTIYNNLLYVRG